MSIACIGWGSLVWDPRDLPVRGRWFHDGPLLPIEFSRVTNDGRVTLVLVEGSASVRSLWTLMDVEDVDAARHALRKREGVPLENLSEDIGYWSREDPPEFPESTVVGAWAERIGLQAVVWTALPPGFPDSRGHVPEVAALLAHVTGLPEGPRSHAEAYVRNTPRQIDTAVRRRFELELGWTPG